ncbi:MAG: hypothetical protein L0I29_14640 [Hyphomicrobiales bacterium]|nr:hypothetical protein [Hyphomicrobiales bacterium]
MLEIIPPGARTELMPGQSQDEHMIPLDAFIDETMALLELSPTPDEIATEQVRMFRDAEIEGRFAMCLNY